MIEVYIKDLSDGNVVKHFKEVTSLGEGICDTIRLVLVDESVRLVKLSGQQYIKILDIKEEK